jgi:DNA repair exonuclease SbcCD ATPase subunit
MSAEPQPVVIKFPPRPKTENPLVLPRRRLRSPFEVSAATAETQKTIDAIRSATRNPWGEALNVDQQKMAELEKSLRQLTQKLEERERSLQDLEARLIERERELAEMENLLQARESLLEAAKSKNAGQADTRPLSHEEQAALEKLKAEVERQQKLLQEQREVLREREAFLDDSETKLFEKVQQQQETETELEQRADELNQRERRLREREAAFDPALAAKIAAEKAAASKPRGEFSE